MTPSATRHAHVLFAQRDGRLFFVVPWLGYSLVGTTDTDYRGDPADVAATDEDVDYLVDEARRAFPAGRFDEVYYTWAGVRALVRVEDVDEGKVSRKHALHDHGRRDGVPGIVSVVGGKITGYRAIAEEVGDLVARKLGHRDRGDSATHVRPLPGGHLADLQTYVARRDLAAGAGARAGSASRRTTSARSTDRWRRRSWPAPNATRASPQRVCPHQPTIARPDRARGRPTNGRCRSATCCSAARRSGSDACQALDCLDDVAEHMAGLLGWDAAERARQIEAYRREIEPMRRFSRAATRA